MHRIYSSVIVHKADLPGRRDVLDRYFQLRERAEKLAPLVVGVGLAATGGTAWALGLRMPWWGWVIAGSLAVFVSFMRDAVKFGFNRVLPFMEPLFAKHLRENHPAWLDANGQPKANLRDGWIGPDERVFAANEDYCRDGNAQAQGIPLFTIAELSRLGWQEVNRITQFKVGKGPLVDAAAAKAALDAAVQWSLERDRQRSARFAESEDDDESGASPGGGSGHYAGAAYDDDDFSSSPEPQWFNPSTGLPTVANTPGGIDVGGNNWGQ